MAELLAFTQSLFFGGDDSVLLELVRAWTEDDRWTVVVNASHPGLETYRRLLPPRARLLTADIPADGAALAVARKLKGLFSQTRPNAILVSSGGFPPTAATLGALLAARWSRVPRLVLAVHNDPNLYGGLPGIWRAGRGRLAAALCDAVVSVSRDCAAKVETAAGRPVRVILNGSAARRPEDDPSALRRELGASAGDELIGAIGNVAPRKGFRTLLEAFRLVARARPRARLVVIGAPEDPVEFEALRKLGADADLSGRASFLGAKSRAWRYAAAFDILVAPSLRTESFGLMALDAMRAGKPVVASRVGGLPEVVADGETGLLVPVGDAAATAAAIERLLADPAAARRMGEAGRRRAEALFSSARMAAEYRETLLPGAPRRANATIAPAAAPGGGDAPGR
jgi:glycosyltransferase involved in cell wall biosynthesis